MPLIDLDSIQLYQGPTKADLVGKRSSMASIGDFFVVYEVRNAPMVFGRSGGWGQRLNDYKLLQVPRTDLILLAATVEAVEKKTKAIHPLRNCCSVSEEHKSRDEQAYD